MTGEYVRGGGAFGSRCNAGTGRSWAEPESGQVVLAPGPGRIWCGAGSTKPRIISTERAWPPDIGRDTIIFFVGGLTVVALASRAFGDKIYAGATTFGAPRARRFLLGTFDFGQGTGVAGFSQFGSWRTTGRGQVWGGHFLLR